MKASLLARYFSGILRWNLVGILLSAHLFCNEGGVGKTPRNLSLPIHQKVFQIGEELTYNVSYASFDIGQVRVQLLDTVRQGGRLYFKAKAIIDSYKGVPFVDLHTIYESTIAESVYATYFHARTKQEADWLSNIYSFDYPNDVIHVERKIFGTDRVLRQDTVGINSHYQDGLSLFYFARTEVLTKRHLDIPTFVNEKKGTTGINFKVERTNEEIDAVDYPIDVVYFEGEAGFVGIFGLTGAFEGWFSNDEARIPIVAKMKVLIGNVRIELMKWKRDGWIPPRATEE